MKDGYKMGVIGLGMGINMLPVNARADIPISVTQIAGTRAQSGVMEALAAQHGLERWTSDWEQMAGDERLDIIGVFSPDALHFSHCMAALEHGKHVVCTKPMVVSLPEAKALAKKVDETGLKFMVGQTMRYEPQFAALRTMFDDGDLGHVFMGEAHYIHDMRPVYAMTPWRIEMPQDMVYGGLSHPIDALRWFFGDVAEVHAVGCKTDVLKSPVTGKQYTDYSNYMVNLKFEGGQVARALGAYGVVEPPQPMMGISLFGDRGSATAEFADFLGGKVKAVFDKFEVKSAMESVYPPETEGAFGHGRTALRYLADFARALDSGAEPQPSVREGAKTVAACSAAYESILTGAVVPVDNDF